MTILHRTRVRSSNSSVHSEDRVSTHNDNADPSEVNVAVEEIRLRGSAELPPEINNEQDRPLIEPDGKLWVLKIHFVILVKISSHMTYVY
jgi:hypothetical protein